MLRSRGFDELDEVPRHMAGPILFLLMALAIYGLIAFGIVDLPEHIGFAFVAMLVVYFVTLIDIRFGIVCLVFAIGLSPEVEYGGAGNLRLEDFLMPGLLIAWLTRSVSKREEFASTSLKAPITMILVLSVVSTVLGAASGTVELQRAFFHVGKTFIYYLMMVLVMNNVDSERSAYIFIITMVVVAVATALHGYGTFALGDGSKVSGPFGESSNILGGYLIFHLALIVGLAFGVPRILHKVILGVCFFVVFKAFLHTMSRTSYVALLLGVGVFAVMKRRTVLIAMFLFLVVVPVIVPSDVLDRAATILDVLGPKPPSSWNARVAGWTKYGRTLMTDPLLGRGVGSIKLADVDNEYMKVLVETGLLGSLAFFWLLYAMAKLSLSTYEKAKNNPLLGAYCLGYLGALFTLAVHGLGATSFTTIRTMEPLMVATGVLVAINNNYDKWHARQPKETTSAFELGSPLRPVPLQGRVLHRRF
ncbi:MAG: O-antigen ligase family protein [Planctomycetota bacterium]|nr:O-antigen ligase family protein [Planctomycetota bacterium]